MSEGPEGKTARREVLDPDWEVALRAGQDEDGHAGSVEDELAIVHLFRHAAAPESLGDAAFDRIWADVEAEIAPAPWWKKLIGWRVAGPALAVAAAAVVVVIVWPREPLPEPKPDTIATAELPTESTADLLAAQFEILAPAARDDIAQTVDAGRGALRNDLIALAVSSSRPSGAEGDGKTVGGAP
jgi:hypothetical protein